MTRGFGLFCAVSFGLGIAQPASAQIRIWPGAAPDARPASGAERTVIENQQRVAGRPWTYVERVSQPTLTVYPAKGINSGAMVVVFPGGGYKILAIDLEGTEVCDWLTARGINCAVLKYRVPDSGPHWEADCKCQVEPEAPMALQDAQRAVGLLRANSAKWKIDPRKIGVLGFSAGGHLVADISTNFERRVYRSVDAADRESCRPDFAVAIYPGHLWAEKQKGLALNPKIRVTRNTPPTFLLQAEDDDVDSVNHSLVYYRALRDARVPVEMHLYARGGHAFGLRKTELPITRWPELVEKWLVGLGMISEMGH